MTFIDFFISTAQLQQDVSNVFYLDIALLFDGSEMLCSDLCIGGLMRCFASLIHFQIMFFSYGSRY